MKHFTAIFVLIFLAVVCSVSARAQDGPLPPPPPPAPKYPLTSWKDFKSTTGGFSVFFPSEPKETIQQSGKAEYHSCKVSTVDGTYSVIWLDMAPTSLENNKAMENNRAIIKRVLQSARSNSAWKWLEGREIEMNGFPGGEYKAETLNGLGFLWKRVYVTGTRIYEVTADTLKREPPLKEPDIFIESFRIAGGIIEGKALKMVPPEYPSIAKSVHAAGAVQVQVTYSEEGKVIEAEALSGHPLLRDAAVAAAKQWLFRPTEINGQRVKVTGILTFNFMLNTSSR